MKERIRALRKALGMTQQEFADKIGLKRNSVASYEIGRNEPMDAVIISISREFNVNERWLRFGEGAMFKAVDKDEEIALYVSELLEDDIDNPDPVYTIVKEIMHTYSQLDNRNKDALKIYAKRLLANFSEKKEG